MWWLQDPILYLISQILLVLREIVGYRLQECGSQWISKKGVFLFKTLNHTCYRGSLELGMSPSSSREDSSLSRPPSRPGKVLLLFFCLPQACLAWPSFLIQPAPTSQLRSSPLMPRSSAGHDEGGFPGSLAAGAHQEDECSPSSCGRGCPQSKLIWDNWMVPLHSVAILPQLGILRALFAITVFAFYQSPFHSSANCKECLGVAGNFPDKTEKTGNKLEGRANRSYLGFIWSNSALALLPRRREVCESSVNPDALVNRLKPADGVRILHFWHQERWAMTGTFKFRSQLPLPRAGCVPVSAVSASDLKKQSWARMRNRLPVF